VTTTGYLRSGTRGWDVQKGEQTDIGLPETALRPVTKRECWKEEEKSPAAGGAGEPNGASDHRALTANNTVTTPVKNVPSWRLKEEAEKRRALEAELRLARHNQQNGN
jgi:hypothetical protein